VQFAEAISPGNVTFALSSTASTRTQVLRSFIKDASSGGKKLSISLTPATKNILNSAEAGINVQETMDTGQLEVRVGRMLTCRDHFDQNAMLALIEEVLQSADTAGYSRTRLLAHMEWALLDKPAR